MKSLSFFVVFLVFFLSGSSVYPDDTTLTIDVGVVEEVVVNDKRYGNEFVFNNTLGWNSIITCVGFIVSFLLLYLHFKKQNEIEERNFKLSINMKFIESLMDSIYDTKLDYIHPVISYVIIKVKQYKLSNDEHHDVEFDKFFLDCLEQTERINDDFKRMYDNLLDTTNILDNYSMVLLEISQFKNDLDVKLEELMCRYGELLMFFPTNENKHSYINNVDVEKFFSVFVEFYIKSEEVEGLVSGIKVKVQEELFGGYFKGKTPVVKSENTGIVFPQKYLEIFERVGNGK